MNSRVYGKIEPHEFYEFGVSVSHHVTEVLTPVLRVVYRPHTRTLLVQVAVDDGSDCG